MGAIKTGWDFFQDQILGMHWLKDLIGNLLVKADRKSTRQNSSHWKQSRMPSSA